MHKPLTQLPGKSLRSLSSIIGLIFLCSTLLNATEYEVIGISPNDVLNVRAQPSSSSEVSAALKLGDDEIKITGEVVLNAGTDWVPISSPIGNGWVRPKFLREVVQSAPQQATAEIVAKDSENVSDADEQANWARLEDDLQKWSKFSPQGLSKIFIKVGSQNYLTCPASFPEGYGYAFFRVPAQQTDGLDPNDPAFLKLKCAAIQIEVSPRFRFHSDSNDPIKRMSLSADMVDPKKAIRICDEYEKKLQPDLARMLSRFQRRPNGFKQLSDNDNSNIFRDGNWWGDIELTEKASYREDPFKSPIQFSEITLTLVVEDHKSDFLSLETTDGGADLNSSPEDGDASLVKQYTGNVGGLRSEYTLQWTGAVVSGTYINPDVKPRIVYSLKGTIDGDQLKLDELTDGTISARLLLKKSTKNGRVAWVGRMNNTDGRVFDMDMIEAD